MNYDAFSEGAAEYRGECAPAAPLFAPGEYRGKSYTPQDIADILENFALHSSGPDPELAVPVVIGHSEEQEYLAGLQCLRFLQGLIANTVVCELNVYPQEAVQVLNYVLEGILFGWSFLWATEVRHKDY